MDFALRVAEDRLSREDSARWVERRALRLTGTQQRRERWLASLPPADRAAVLDVLASGESRRFLASVGNVL